MGTGWEGVGRGKGWASQKCQKRRHRDNMSATRKQQKLAWGQLAQMRL